MPVVTLTDITIRNLHHTPGKQVTYYDQSVKGFGVRLSQHGHASFVLVIGANRQRVKLGDVGIVKLQDARQAAKNLLAEKQLGHHFPARSGAFQEAVDDFLEAKAPKVKPRTLRDYKRLLTRHGFKQEKLSAVTPNGITKKLKPLPPSERFHAHIALGIFFRWCFRGHLVERNPMERMEPPTKGKSRERVLTDADLKAVWNAAEGDFGDIIKLCILLGQRRSEIAALQWDWIKDDTITLPETVTKNGREHTFPIGKMAAAIIANRTKHNSHPYLFPARKKWKDSATIYNAWGKDMPKLRTASTTEKWVPHDCRRTLRTRFAKLRIPREVAEKYINHISGVQAGVESIYDRHSYLPEMKRAVVQYEKHIHAIVTAARSDRAAA